MKPITLFELDCKTPATPAADPSETPRDFDHHWFGWVPVGAVAAEIVSDLLFQRQDAGGLG